MEHITMEQGNRFVASKLALLDDEVKISAAEMETAWIGVQARVDVRVPMRDGRWRWTLAVAAGLAGLFLLTPAGRIWAQTVWSRFVLNTSLNVQIDLEHATPSLLLPNVFPLYPQNEALQWPAGSAEEAAALAGFSVRTLAGPRLQPSPKFQVIQPPPVIDHVFDLATAQADIRRLGRVMPAVPSGIEGAHIILEPQGKTVVSRYGTCPQLIGPWEACAMLVQSRPMVLKLPSSVSLPEYARFSLELAGLSASEAESVLALAGGSSTLFLPLETKAEVRPARVRGAAAMLAVYPPSERGETAYMLDWREGEFDFRLFGRDPEGAVSLAESLR
jgi:hypothetical protein